MGAYTFAFFDSRVDVELPDESLVPKTAPDPAPPIGDVYRSTRDALRDPIGTPPLSAGIDRESRILVAVPDRSRHTDIRAVLRAVLDEIAEAGAERERVTLLVALGTHRPMSDREIAEKVGEDVARTYRVMNHDYDDPAMLVDLGETADGLPVEFNRQITEHDYIVSIGAIAPHPVGGFSGGAKGLLPGIAGKRSTDYFHWAATGYPLFEIFGNPDNPVRHEMEGIVRSVGLDCIVNVTENAEREISGVFAGHFIEAHRAGVAFLREHPSIAFPLEMTDLMIVGLGRDRPDFWGGAAGIYAAAAFLKPQGTLVLFAACPEGVAPEHPVVTEYGYRRWREIAGLVEEGVIPDRTGASHLVTVGRILDEKEIEVLIVSEGIDGEDAAVLGFSSFEKPQDAVDEAISRAGSDARILIYERI